jgi:agmatinase
MADATMFQAEWNFLGLPKEQSDAARSRAWVLPVPYESTTCYGAGTRDGPAAIIAASRAIERYDREFGCQPAREIGIHTLAPLKLTRGTPEGMIGAIEEAVAAIMTGTAGSPHSSPQGAEENVDESPSVPLSHGEGWPRGLPLRPPVDDQEAGGPRPELLAVLGGEHTLSAGVVRGLARATKAKSKDLVVVQIDAHADLWDEYEGSRYSHACAARRISETCPLFQIGIRNIAQEEEQFAKESKRVKIVFAPEAIAPDGAFLKNLAKFVKGKTVFLTVDVDGLDPSIMPSTGTPEPGGLGWYRVLDIVKTVCGNAASVPAFDVVELAPIAGLRAPDFLAARLVYEIITRALLKQNSKSKIQDEK